MVSPALASSLALELETGAGKEGAYLGFPYGWASMSYGTEDARLVLPFTAVALNSSRLVS